MVPPADTSPRPPLVRGIGLVTPLGGSAWATTRALLEGRTITDRLDRAALPDLDPFEIVRGAGCVRPSRFDPDDPSIRLAEAAAREALLDASVPDEHGRHPDLPVVVASSKGAILALLTYGLQHRAAALTPHGLLADGLARRLGSRDVRCVVGACASGLVALEYARRRLRRAAAATPGRGPTRILVVGVEAALAPLLLASYRRLGVLPPLDPAGYRGRPLDRRRAGFVLVETAAALLLECPDEDEPNADDLTLLGVSTLAEGHDLVRTDPSAATRRRLAEWAGRFAPIDLVHPHATGTRENDERELGLLADVWGEATASRMPAYAVKGALGHGLGASGLVSSAVAAMIARTGRLPGMPWLEEPIETPFRLSRRPTRLRPRRQAIFSAGFGGHVGAAVLGTNG